MFATDEDILPRRRFAEEADLAPALDRLGDVYAASVDAATFVDNTAGRAFSRVEAYERHNRKVRDITGVTLDNPAILQTPDLPMRITRGEFSGWSDPRIAELQRARVDAWLERLQLLASQNPEKSDDILPPPLFAANDDAAEAVARATGRAEQDAFARGPTFWRWPAAFVGGAVGALRDPITLPSMFLASFGIGARATTVAGRIAGSMVDQAAVAAATTTATQPMIQAWRAQSGLEAGWDEAVSNIAFAATFGAVMGGTLRGGGEAWRAYTARRAELPAEVRGALDATEAARAATPAPVRGLDEDAAAVELEHAIRRAEDPDLSAPAVPVEPAPPRPAGRPVIGDDVEAPALRSFTYDGKPVTQTRFDPAALETDATAFQYKGGGDARGVTDALMSVRVWDPIASGKIVVYERADGTRVIADGHQRAGLARRLKDEGQDVALDGYLLREADGWTVPEARALAALKNIREGSGSPLDTARFLREGHRLDASVPRSRGHIAQAEGLARLSDEVFGQVVNEVIPLNYAALIGRFEPDPANHGALAEAVRVLNPQNEAQASIAIQDAQTSIRRKQAGGQTQGSLFGDDAEVRVSLAAERMRVLADTIRSLKAESRIFGVLARDPDVIEQAGNQLDRAANAGRLDEVQRLGAILTGLALRTGPVSAMLNRAAAAFADGATLAQARKGFLDEVTAALEQGGLRALQDGPEPAGTGTQGNRSADAQPAPSASARPLEGVGDGDMLRAVPVDEGEAGLFASRDQASLFGDDEVNGSAVTRNCTG